MLQEQDLGLRDMAGGTWLAPHVCDPWHQERARGHTPGPCLNLPLILAL